MSWLPIDQTLELIQFASWADREARSDLAGSYIHDEDDYTANFTGALRRIINSNSQTGLTATSLMLSPQDEQRTGTDATIIITRKGESKIALFEAKWPRITNPHYQWDYNQSATGLSHFSDQLARQHRLCKRFAIFEMFFCECEFGKQPTYMQKDGSSCVWHGEAHTFMNSRTNPDAVWDQADLVSMLQSGSVSIGDILRPFCACTRGEVFRMDKPKEIVLEFNLPPRILVVQSNTDNRTDCPRKIDQ